MDDAAPNQVGDHANSQPVTEAPSPRAKALREEMLGSALTLDEVAYILSLDRTTVAKYLRENTLVGFQIGREWRVAEEELRKYVRSMAEGRRTQGAELERAGGATATSHRGILPDFLLRRAGLSKAPPAAGSTKFDKFTRRARHVLQLAQEEAVRFNHNYIGTEHLLLGLLREGEGVAAKVLSQLGVEVDRVRSSVESVVGRGDRPVLGEVGLTPRAKKVIELALDEARRLGHHYIGTEHLLLGMLREGDGVAAGVLESFGLQLEQVRTGTLNVLSQAPRELLEEGLPEPWPVPDEATNLVGAGEEARGCTSCGARSPLYFRYCFNCGRAFEAS